MAEAYTRHDLPAETVWTTVVLDRGHVNQRIRINGTLRISVVKTGNSTHGYQVKLLRMDESRAMRINTAPRA